MNTAPRVLLVDDDNASSRVIAARIARRLGYDALYAVGEGENLVEDAKAKARSFRPHVIVLDWRLHGDYEDARCEELLADLPSCGKILYSEWATLQQASQVRNRFRVEALHKQAPADDILDLIRRVANQQCGCDWRLEGQPFAVEWPPSWPPGLALKRILGPETTAPEDLVDSLLWQLFEPRHDGDERRIGYVVLGEMDGSVRSQRPLGAGHAVVLAANLNDHHEPVITKIAERSHIERERRNFDKFVDRNIRGGFYSVLHNDAYFHELGALEYSLVGGSLTDVTSFAAWHRASDAAPKIVKPLRHFFRTAWEWHYRNSLPYDRPLSEYGRPVDSASRLPRGRACLYDLYDPPLRLGERITLFADRRTAQPIPGLPDAELPHPIRWLERHWDESAVPNARVAVTHGDLHGGNLLVDGEHGWAIDFERTGWGHWLRDFVELEVDLLTRLMILPAADGPAVFLQLAVGLVSKLEGDNRVLKPFTDGDVTKDPAKTIKVVAALRRLMGEVAKPNDPREYFWGLLLDAAFAAAWAPESSEARERALLLGGVICDRLEHWTGDWPLREMTLLSSAASGV